jgi:O-antigen ligase
VFHSPYATSVFVRPVNGRGGTSRLPGGAFAHPVRDDVGLALVAGSVAAIIAVGLASISPVAVLAVVIILAVGAFAFLRPFWGLGLAIALSPLERFGIPAAGLQVTIADLLSLAAAAGWVTAHALNWRTLPVPRLLFAPLVLLLFTFLPATMLAENLVSSFKQFAAWVNFFLLFWMIAATATREQVKKILGAIAFAGGLAGAITVLDPALDLYGRASGPFGQPNTLGQFVVLAIPLQAYFLLRGTPVVRALSGVGLLVCLYALSVTLSRASWAGCLAAGLLLLVWRPARIPALALIVTFAALVAAGFNPVSGVIDTGQIIDRIADASDPSSSEASNLRSDVYGVAPRIILDNPLGVGAYNFDTVAGEYGLGYFPFNTPVTSSAENIVFGLGTEQGILAIVGFLWLCIAGALVLFALWRSHDRDGHDLAVALTGVLASQIIASMYHYGLHSNVITLATFTILGCAMALHRMVEHGSAEPSSDGPVGQEARADTR